MRKGVVLSHFFVFIPSQNYPWSVSMRVRNDLNCEAWDAEYNQRQHSVEVWNV